MASTSNSTLNIQHPSIPIFEGENYDFWCIKMKTLFISQDVWELVENGYEDYDSQENLTNTQKEELKKNRKIDAKALLFIQQGVGNTIFPRIMRASKAKEVWDILLQEFQGDIKVRAIKLQTLKKEFENMKMRENENLKEYFSRFMELVN